MLDDPGSLGEGAQGASGLGAYGASGTASAGSTAAAASAATSVLGYVATALVTTALVGGSVFGLSLSDLAAQSLRAASTLPFNFQPAGLTARLQDSYTEKVIQQAAAFTTGGTQLTELAQAQLAKISSVSSNIVAQAQQDKTQLTQQSANTPKLTSFTTSDDSKIVIDPPGPKTTPTPQVTTPGTPSVFDAVIPIAGATGTPQTVVLVPFRTAQPTLQPTQQATPVATGQPTVEPTSAATVAATAAPTVAATVAPTIAPTVAPTAVGPTDTPVPPTSTPAPPTATPAPPTNTPVPPTNTPLPTNTPIPPTPTDTPAPPTPTDTPIPSTATPLPPTTTPTSQPVQITNSKGTGFALMTLSGMVPGDSISRPLTITNSGGSGFGSFTYTLSTNCPAPPPPAGTPTPTPTANCAPGTAGLLWTDTTNGLQLKVTRNTTVLYNGPINVTNQSMGGVVLAPSQSDNITVQVSLPATAPNSFANLSTTMAFVWTATSYPF